MDLDPAAEGQGPNPLQQVESGALEGDICQGLWASPEKPVVQALYSDEIPILPPP